MPLSAVAPICVGDCDGGGEVRVDEILALVSIALGNAEPSACTAGIPTGTTVDVALVLESVTNALNGCGAGPTGNS